MTGDWHKSAMVGIFAMTCLSGLAIYLWACRAVLHRAEAQFKQGPETIEE